MQTGGLMRENQSQVGGGCPCVVVAWTVVWGGKGSCVRKGGSPGAWDKTSNRKLELRWSDENIPCGHTYLGVMTHPETQGYAQVGKSSWDIRTRMRRRDMHIERGINQKGVYILVFIIREGSYKYGKGEKTRTNSMEWNKNGRYQYELSF